MSQRTWSAVDAYVAEHLIPEDPVLDAAVAACRAARLPTGAILPGQDRLTPRARAWTRRS
jgi:hypothetical protein